MGIELGKFKVVRVSDGDTIKVDRDPIPEVCKRNSLRLLSLDTEETSNPKSFGPVTAFAKEVTDLANQWFKKRGNEVILKTDGTRQVSGYFHRPLVQVFAEGEHYQHYAIANGWSPYFCKYGYSIDYHQSLVEAEQHARENKKGIWSDELRNRPKAKNRPYDQLCQWWQNRAEQIEKARGFKDEIYKLLNGEDYEKIYAKAKQEEKCLVFGEITRVSGGRSAGSGLFIVSVKLDLPFYLYIARDCPERNQVIKAIEDEFVSNRRDLPNSWFKPNFAFMKGQLSLFARQNNKIPELIIRNRSQISKEPI